MPIKAASETAPHRNPESDVSSREAGESGPPAGATATDMRSEVAADVDRLFADSAYWAIVRDLRIEHSGGAASIDHLILNRNLEMFVCASEGFGDGLCIGEEGEFQVYEGLTLRPIASPLEANRVRVAALRELFARGVVPLPVRDGKPVEPVVTGLVLLSRRARVSRPKTLILGIESIVKADQLDGWLQRHLARQERSAASRVAVDRTTLEEIAVRIAQSHVPPQGTPASPSSSPRQARARRRSKADAS